MTRKKNTAEILQPYLITILVAIFGTLTFIFTFDGFIKTNYKEQNAILESNFALKRDSLLSVIQNQESELSKQEGILAELERKKEEEKRFKIVIDSLITVGADVTQSVGNDIKYEKRIDSILKIAKSYLEDEKFIAKKHRPIINELNRMFSINGLSDPQNAKLRFSIKDFNEMEINTFLKKSRDLSQLDFSKKLSSLLKLKRLSKFHIRQLTDISKILGNEVRYIIEKDDSLASISKKFNVSIKELKKLNPKAIGDNNKIKEGETLIIFKASY